MPIDTMKTTIKSNLVCENKRTQKRSFNEFGKQKLKIIKTLCGGFRISQEYFFDPTIDLPSTQQNAEMKRENVGREYWLSYFFSSHNYC